MKFAERSRRGTEKLWFRPQPDVKRGTDQVHTTRGMRSLEHVSPYVLGPYRVLELAIYASELGKLKQQNRQTTEERTLIKKQTVPRTTSQSVAVEFYHPQKKKLRCYRERASTHGMEKSASEKFLKTHSGYRSPEVLRETIFSPYIPARQS